MVPWLPFRTRMQLILEGQAQSDEDKYMAKQDVAVLGTAYLSIHQHMALVFFRITSQPRDTPQSTSNFLKIISIQPAHN